MPLGVRPGEKRTVNKLGRLCIHQGSVLPDLVGICLHECGTSYNLVVCRWLTIRTEEIEPSS